MTHEPASPPDSDAHDLVGEAYTRGYNDACEDACVPADFYSEERSEGCAQVQADFAPRIAALSSLPPSVAGAYRPDADGYNWHVKSPTGERLILPGKWKYTDDDHRQQCEALCAQLNAALSSLPVSELADEIERVFAQYRSDLSGAHAEICKLQGLDPATHHWPEWTPQANSLRWLDKIEPRILSALRSPARTEQEIVTEIVAKARANADEYRDAKRNRPVPTPEDLRWDARMDGAENALRSFAHAIEAGAYKTTPPAVQGGET